MKPNLLVVQPPHIATDAIIDRFCESLCDTHYVYLIRPITTFRDDSPAGVRFLKFTPDHLPGFGEIESVIIVGESDIAGRLQEQYPTAHHAVWNLESHGERPFSLVPSLAANVIDGQFGHAADQTLARAI